MPRKFTDEERERVNAALLAAGERRFSSYGLAKTTVDELTRDAGISKGAFYRFYESKEDLFFELIDRYERTVRAEIEEDAAGSSAERLATALKHYMKRVAEEPLMASLLSGDAARQLWRGGSTAARRRNMESDFTFVERLIPADAIDHRVVTGMLRSLFFLIPHREEIGEEVFEEVVDHLVDAVTAHIFEYASGEGE
jgi:AcrR family transcriptional regulator